MESTEARPSNLFREYLLPRLRGTFLVRLVAQVMGFISSLLLTRWLGASGYGVFAFSFSIVTLAALPASLGFRSLLTREVAQYVSLQDWSKLRGLLRFSPLLTLLASFTVALIMYGVSSWVPWPADADLRSGLQMAIWSLPLFAMVPVWQGTLTGLHQTHRAQIPEAIVRPVFFLGALLLMKALGESFSVHQAIFVNIGAMAIAFSMSYGLVRRYTPKSVRTSRPVYQSGTWLRSGVLFLLISGMHVLNSHTDMLMIGTLLDAKAAGVYQIPVRLGSLLLFPFIVMEMVVAPLIAQSYTEGKLPKLAPTLRKLVGAVFVLTLIGGILLAVLRMPVLGWFGPEFPAGSSVLLWFVTIVLVQILFGPVGYLMTMTGRERITTKVMAASAVLNVILNLILIPKYGIEGAAMATLGSELLWKGLLYLQVRKQLHIRPGILPF